MEVTGKIQESIRKRAKSYTPEWSFHIENPDIGSALAIAYAQMLAGTVKKFSKIPQKNRIAFFNELDTDVLPAVPSHGYVQFQLVNEEVEGSLVKPGTTVLASDEGLPDGQAAFETCEELYVTPAAVSDIYQACDESDSIYRLYDRKNIEWQPFALFSGEGVNLQKHELYISQEDLFYIHSEAYIALTFFSQGDVLLKPADLDIMADSENAVFEYYSKEGWVAFEDFKKEENRLVFYKGGLQPEFEREEIEGKKSFWIRMRILNFRKFSKMRLESICLTSWNQGMLPDTVFGSQEELNPHSFFPFGESLSMYQEVYFGSEEVLSKRGAQVTFSFSLDFVKIPLNTNEKEALNWEWVMKRSDIKQDIEFDITAESVIWEYYNGSGWTRLFPDDRYNHIFYAPSEGKGQYQTLQFICPDDIEKILVNAVETYYIRARVMKINNLYKVTGNYVVPMISNTSFQYRYLEKGKMPENYVSCNNLEYCSLEGGSFGKDGLYSPFFQTGMEEAALYLGFEVSPSGSPLKMLFCIEGDGECARPPLLWEYWNGSRWKKVNPVDGTDCFSKTGVVTFAGNTDMEKKRLFKKERYWIRIKDIENSYSNKDAVKNYPVLQQIYMNVVTVQNVYRRQREYFQMETYQENKTFRLLEKNIYDAKVYVDETGHLAADELEGLRQKQSVRTEEDVSGMDGRIWVEWRQVTDFSESGPMDRHFVIHPYQGEILFGNGKYGRIPYTSGKENIFIDYSSGGGKYTNLQAGKINRMSRSVGYISEVTNPEAMTGGCDAETPEAAMQRTSGFIRHQGRAVLARDYEQLAMCAVRDVLKVKCFAGYDDTGKRVSGAVTLVVLQKQFSQGRMHFLEVRERILQYMKDKVSAPLSDNRKFFVVPPEFIEIRLYIELSVENFNQIIPVKQEILERLEQFFSHSYEQEDKTGWEIGSFPDTVQVKNAIHDINGIVYIRNIMMSAYAAGSTGWEEVDIDIIKTHKYILPVGGEQKIMVEVSGNDTGMARR